jgi:hypothetical protein
MRTTREAVTFDHPFSLASVDETFPAGTYAVDIDEDLIEGISFLAYRRVATVIYLPLAPGQLGSLQAVRVDPHELDAARRVSPPSSPAPPGVDA